jgi:hypothetical protein
MTIIPIMSIATDGLMQVKGFSSPSRMMTTERKKPRRRTLRSFFALMTHGQMMHGRGTMNGQGPMMNGQN